MRQTHVSLIFLAGDHVYKIKKPVRLDFLDFSTLEKRRYFCEEEVRLNRRLSPEVYLGVVPVVRTDGGIRLDATPAGEVVDYAVCMRRLPEDRMLERLLEAGSVNEAMLDEIVAVLAGFHRRAPGGPEVDRHARPAVIRELILGNLAELPCRLEESGLSAGSLLGPLTEAAEGFLSERRDLLEQRIAEGRIREGHGDLHVGNICMTDGRVVIYDCIEFDMALRCVDTARDVGFL
ncbi:MAG: phosphotransferase, partial [Planctomycetota bacterium]